MYILLYYITGVLHRVGVLYPEGSFQRFIISSADTGSGTDRDDGEEI